MDWEVMTFTGSGNISTSASCLKSTRIGQEVDVGVEDIDEVGLQAPIPSQEGLITKLSWKPRNDISPIASARR